ncbi:ComEA family DNA-binding protein [Occallatibacter riparius]|uniref:Helix-hairpin-helix domain-containing protein n=1 Tax=Occallatibacter riparius TaxID=1002689 RepID=A0A9J7BTM3_9BACT|nr:helix-hairpin-helix domain-containing protein [Occallatibacter riparius]UWZ85098.1 helix-hairpin-helix domain-containing protein [Occallatibacter riparius]
MHRILAITALLLMVPCATPQAPARAAFTDTASKPSSAEDLVDINHANLEQLLQVPGMTRSWAERIVRYRPYRTKLDLVQNGVMPLDVYKRIRDHIIAHQDKKQ